MKRRKRLFAALISFSMVITFSMVFAYWATSINGVNRNQIATLTISEGQSAVTDIELGTAIVDGKVLVPAGFVKNVSQTDAAEVVINVKWVGGVEDKIDGAIGRLSISHVDTAYSSGGDATSVEDLFQFDFGGTYSIIGNDATGTDVLITVSMDEPLTKEQYNAVANQSLVFTFNFEVVAS